MIIKIIIIVLIIIIIITTIITIIITTTIVIIIQLALLRQEKAKIYKHLRQQKDWNVMGAKEVLKQVEV